MRERKPITLERVAKVAGAYLFWIALLFVIVTLDQHHLLDWTGH